MFAMAQQPWEFDCEILKDGNAAEDVGIRSGHTCSCKIGVMQKLLQKSKYAGSVGSVKLPAGLTQIA